MDYGFPDDAFTSSDMANFPLETRRGRGGGVSRTMRRLVEVRVYVYDEMGYTKA